MAEHKTSKLIARTTLEGYTLANIVTENGILVATVMNDTWAKLLVTAANNHDKLVKALQGCETLLTMIESDHPYSVPLILNQARQALKDVETQHECSPVSMSKRYGKIRDGRIIGGTEDLPNTASEPS